jgi:hypothetical protein
MRFATTTVLLAISLAVLFMTMEPRDSPRERTEAARIRLLAPPEVVGTTGRNVCVALTFDFIAYCETGIPLKYCVNPPLACQECSTDCHPAVQGHRVLLWGGQSRGFETQQPCPDFGTPNNPIIYTKRECNESCSCLGRVIGTFPCTRTVTVLQGC